MKLGSVIGQTLDGKYRIEKQLGKGGMGTVYLATHIGTERPVAVKVIASEFMKRAEFIERFRREARAAGRLRHPNVVDVTDFGFSATSDGDVAYLVMEYLDGCTLGEVLEEEKHLPVSWTVDIIEQVCSAVHEAHQEGIIHRDLKPDNIWLEPNQRGGYTVKVLDFGIAKLEEHEARLAGEYSAILPDGADSASHHARGTLAGSSSASTVPDIQNLTAISERETIIQDQDQPKAGGRPTVAINAAPFDAAGKDVPDDTGPVPDGDTKLMPADDNAATKLISPGADSRDEPQGAANTNRGHAPVTAALTRVGAVLGTPLYMSPEQCRGEHLTPQSDIYSLGVIVYQMLSGKTPFEGDHTDVMEAHKSAEPPPLEGKKIRKRLKKVLASALAKTPAERPRTAEGLASELRSSSEGLGILLQRAMVIYSQRLPKFLQIAFILAIPSIILTVISVALRFLVAADIVPDGVFAGFLSAFLGLTTFFVQICYSALLVGMSTWIVAQVLAAPLRPISVKEAFGQVRLRLKPLLKTVTVSTLISMLGVALCLLPGVFLSARYMLIAPSIMMEGISGRTAFKRSIELGKRSFRTVFATSVLVYMVPIVMAVVIGLAIGGIINALNPKTASTESPAVAEQTGTEGTANEADTARDGDSNEAKPTITVGKRNIFFSTETGEDKDKSMARNLRVALQQGIFELIWAPLVILISSFTSVLTALLYFKTRQAGGETMQGLLQQFEEAECSTSKWRNRVRQRLIRSGRTTGGRKFNSGPADDKRSG